MANVVMGKCPTCGNLLDDPICNNCGEVKVKEFVDYKCKTSKKCCDCEFFKKECNAWETEKE